MKINVVTYDTVDRIRNLRLDMCITLVHRFERIDNHFLERNVHLIYTDHPFDSLEEN